jgi:catechol 2,3-dioxygenase-like lactoylglutathione lyase family enzyme
MAPITHLRSIAITAELPAELLDFYENTWGLRQVGTSPTGGLRLRARGGEHHVFTLEPGDNHSLERITLGAQSAAAVDEIADRARRVGIAVEYGPGRPPNDRAAGYTVVLRDPEGRRVEINADVPVHPDTLSGVAGPDRLSHIVLNTTNMAAAKNFFVGVLGFRISDWYENELMVFLSCNELHHCIALAPGAWTSLNHAAFEVASADEVMHALGRMRKAGYNTVWGPGRHGPGGNVFAYFVDPVGNVIEYTAEVIVIGAHWQAQSWARNAENADVWGTSDPLTPPVLEAMSNPPAHARTEGDDS